MELFAFQEADEQHPSNEDVDSTRTLDPRTAAIVENMSDAFMALDEAWNITYINTKAADLLQSTRADLIEKNFWTEFPEALNTRFDSGYHNVLATKMPERFEAFFPRVNIWVEVTAYPSDHGVVIFFRDITERREAAEALEESEQLFSAVWEFAAEAMVLSDPEGIVIAANPAYYALYGFSPEEVIGKNYAIIFPEESREAAIESYKEIFSREDMIPAVESTIRCKDNSVLLVESTYRFIIENGRRTAMLSQVRDITQARRSQTSLEAERVRVTAILNATTEGIFGVDKNGNCTFINPAALDFLGYTAEECLGKNIHDLIHYKHADGSPYPNEECPSFAALHTGATVRLLDEVVWHKDGRAMPVLFSCSPKVDEGRIIGCVTTIVDISAQKQAEEERAQLLAQEQSARAIAERAVRAQEELLSVVSHDLRNPIAVIQGVAQLMKRRVSRGVMPDAEQLMLQLTRITDAVTKMDNFIRDLSSSDTLQPGHLLSIIPERVDLVELARNVAHSHQQQADRHTITVSADEDAVVGNWDPVRLEQVLDNLISNAVKYSPKGGEVRINVGYAKKSAEGMTATMYNKTDPASGDCAQNGQAMLTIQDSGMGIPSADLPYVFEWYRRGSNVTDAIAGSGVGLAGVRQIVEQHGGRVSVESKEGKGSKFTVCLPVNPAVEQEASESK